MSRHTRWIALVFGVGLMAALAACGSDTASSGAAPGPTPTVEPSVNRVGNSQDDLHDDGADEAVADDGHDPTVEAHIDVPHEEIHEEAHDEEHSEAVPHSHGVAIVDPDAPVIHVVANEFLYTPGDFEVEAGHSFTIMLHNEGALEHDITIEGFEELGGIHLVASEDGMASFTLDEPGEYTYYCTVPGHRGAGMTGTLIVEADSHAE